jgi:predicted ATP-grasp superfamily ATP-dependent carboligase
MRILVHEFVSGGGLAGRAVPPSLAREGAAMRDALVEDLAALGTHDIVTTADPRFPLRRAPRGVEVVSARAGHSPLDALFGSTDAAWLVAPETGGCLERLAAQATSRGVRLLGPNAGAIRRAADKASLPRRLAERGVPHPATRVVRSRSEALRAASRLGFPVVVKPARGAGCDGVSLARRAADLDTAFDKAQRAGDSKRVLVQSYVLGKAASVALLSDGRRTLVLAVSAQALVAASRFAYAGGETPLAHPQAGRAAALAQRACRSLPGLKGYVGVDVVLTESGAVVIEVNPRLTTAYLGVRAALAENVADLALAACAGRLGAAPTLRRRVSFTAAGRVTSA